jgi:hypothetical protein
MNLTHCRILAASPLHQQRQEKDPTSASIDTVCGCNNASPALAAPRGEGR